MPHMEYSSVEIREILREMFPHRKLVLSQLTFFNSTGITSPSGVSSQRGRQRFCLEDILPIACVLELKERGIPLARIPTVPKLISRAASRIIKEGCLLIGCNEKIDICFQSDAYSSSILDAFLDSENGGFFWSIDLKKLADELSEAAQNSGNGKLVAVA